MLSFNHKWENVKVWWTDSLTDEQTILLSLPASAGDTKHNKTKLWLNLQSFFKALNK